MRPSRSLGACARPVSRRSSKLPGCWVYVCRAASKMTPPTLMSTSVSVATLWSETRCLSFSAPSYSMRNFSRSSVNRRRPCWISLSIACRSSCSRTRASSRSWRICRAAPATSASARRRSSRILSHSACFCATNSCQTRAFSSSNSWRSLRSTEHSSWICFSAFSSQRVKVFRMSPTITLNSSCEASRGASISGMGPPARLAGRPVARLPGGPTARLLSGAAAPPARPLATPKLDGGIVLLVPGIGFPEVGPGERRPAESEAPEAGIIAGNHAAPS
mmetsp:Transcript_97540/g.259093  ORF Transcript_97540/g.259093 Transcript_97540/m.259093 type:complete len:276 (+) Transcript_97540:1074-1901(+)